MIIPPKGHIVFCGYSASAESALDSLQNEIADRGLVIVSQKTVPSLPGVKHLNLNFFTLETLKNKKLALKDCSVCVVFAEFHAGEDTRLVDMHTALTVYNIRKEYPDINIIAEIIDEENIAIINDLNCDDIIYKETLDGNIIINCILHPNISPIIYDLLTVQGKQLKQSNLEGIGLMNGEVTFREVRLRGLEQDVTFLGFITPGKEVKLIPSNSDIIRPDYTLIFIQ